MSGLIVVSSTMVGGGIGLVAGFVIGIYNEEASDMPGFGGLAGAVAGAGVGALVGAYVGGRIVG